MVLQKQRHAHIATYVVEIFKRNKVLYTHIGREKLLNFANCEPFTKISSPIFTDTLKMYLAYARTVTYLPHFSTPIAFTCMVRQTFPILNFSHVL